MNWISVRAPLSSACARRRVLQSRRVDPFRCCFVQQKCGSTSFTNNTVPELWWGWWWCCCCCCCCCCAAKFGVPLPTSNCRSHRCCCLNTNTPPPHPTQFFITASPAFFFLGTSPSPLSSFPLPLPHSMARTTQVTYLTPHVSRLTSHVSRHTSHVTQNSPGFFPNRQNRRFHRNSSGNKAAAAAAAAAARAVPCCRAKRSFRLNLRLQFIGFKVDVQKKVAQNFDFVTFDF